MEENEIYKFFKENNLTQLDESSFIKKYSDPKESAKLHSFMTENNLTTKEPSVFHNDYFVKKKESSQETTDQSSVSTPSDIGLDSPSVSQTEQVQDSPNQEQSLRAVSDTQSPWQTSPSREGGFTAQDIDFEQAEKDALIKAAQTQIKVQEDAKDPNSPWSKNIFKSQEDTEKARVEDFQKDYAKNLKESILNQIPEDLRGSQTFEQTLKEQGVNLDITGEGKIGNRNILESAGNALKKGGSDLFFTMAWLSNQQNPALKLALETKKKEVGYDLSKKINTYEKNFTESLGSGDFENASGILLNTLGESAPVMVAAATTGSLGALPSMGVLSGITGAQEYLNVKDEKWFNEMSNLGKVGYVSAMGGFEGFGEMMGGRVINRIAKDVVKQGFTKTTKSSLSQMLKGAAKSYGVNMSEEALGEAVTSAGQYLAGKIAKGEEINWSEFLKQTFEGGALGAAMGSGFTTVGNVARTAYGMAKKSKPVIAAEEKVERIKEEVKTAETQAEKEATTKAAAKAIEEKQSVFKEEKAKAEKISEEDRTAIAEKDAQIDSKQAELEGLANKPETAKYVQDEITTLQNEISEIENKYEQQEAIEDATQEQSPEQVKPEDTEVSTEKGEQTEVEAEVNSYDDNQTVTITVKDESEIPEPFKDRAKATGGLEASVKKTFMGIPYGKSRKVKSEETLTYTATGKELKDYFNEKSKYDTQEQEAEQPRPEATGVLEGERPSDSVESRGEEPRLDEGAVEGNKGYRAGDLTTKAEEKGKFGNTSRGTGHFGTGFYFFSGKDKASKHDKGTDRGVSEIDLDGYNLAEGTKELHGELKSANDKHHNEGKDIESSDVEKIASKTGVDLSNENPYQEFKPRNNKQYEDLQKKYTPEEIREGERKSDEWKSETENIAERVNEKLKDPKNKDTASTLIMKELGFEGVDSRKNPELDNAIYGSVVYDIKKPVQQKALKPEQVKKQELSETTKEKASGAKTPRQKSQSAKAAPAEKSEKSESSSKESQKEKPLRPIESSSKKDDVKPANEFEEGKKAAKEEARKKAEENKVISKRKKLTNAVKRKVKGNKYTNINNNVSSLVELPLHKVKDKKLAEELDKVLTDLNRGRVALYKGEDLSKLKERAEADIAKNEVVKETLKDSKAINGVVERVDKKIEGLKKLDSVKETEGTAAKELTSLEKEVGTLSSSLEKAKERNEQLRDLEEISQAEYEITKKNIKESEKLLEERLNELGVKKEKVTEKLNNASKDNLGKINESWMTPEQKDAYERFKDEVESEKDLSKAEDVFVMTEDLVNEYFPVSEMSRYTISKKNEKGGNRLGKAMESNKARRNKLFNLPPSGLTTKVRIKKLLNILAGRTAGTLGFGNLKTETGILSYLKSRDLSQLEEMALMIKDGTLTKEVIDPILSAFTRADNTRDNALENYYNVLEKGIVSKVRNGASIKEAVESSKKESFRAGVYLMQKHIESEYGVKDYLVRLAASTSMQRYSRWEKKIIEEMSLNASSKKNYSKLSSKEKALAKEGRKIFDEQKSKVDYIQDLRGVRRQDFAEYMPLNRRVGQRSKTTEETLSKDDVVGNAMNPKIAAGNAKRRESIVKSDGDVYAYEMNLSKALERLVTETTRDYEMTEAIREIRGVLKEAQKNENLDRTTKEYLAAIEKRVYDSVKKHFNRPYSKSEGIVDKLTSAFYALKLNVPDRIVTEVATEMYRISMMGDVGNVKEAISQLEQRIDVSINNALKPKKDRKTTDVEKLMVHTGSSFLKNTVKHQGETKQKYRGEKGFGKMNAAVGAIPDMLTMNNVWMPAFRAEFEKVTGGDKFDLAEFSRSKAYREKYKKEMLEAKAIAERETARLKGSTLKGGSKVASPHAFTKIRRLFGDETATGFSTLSEKDSERIAAKLNSVMASFGARESARFGREMADIQLSDSYKDKGMAAKNAFVQFSSGVMYGALRGYTGLMMLSFILGMDDDESEFEKGINEQLDNYWSGEFVYESAKSNALFIASSPYGQSSRALALGAAGIRVLALEDEKLGKSKSEKKEIDKKIENIEESTKLTFFAKPTTDTESILKAILPQVSEFGYPAVETAIDLISDIDYESNADLTKEEVQAIQYLTTLNNVQRIFFAYKGTQLPLVQRDVNRILDNYKYKIKKRKKKSKGMKGTSIGGN